jgi:hypothetical protein
MIKEIALKDALLALAEQGKQNYLMLSSVLTELVSLRETVRGLDPTFADVLREKQKEAAENNAPVVVAVVLLYDTLLRRLKAGEVC